MTRINTRVVMAALTLGGTVLGCRTDPGNGPLLAPEIASMEAALNPTNTLSGIVTYRASRSDSARVLFWSDSDPVVETPFFPGHTETGQVPVLGLRSRTAYQVVLEVRGPGGSTRSDPIELQSGDLPAPLRNVRLDISGSGAPPPGFLLTGVTVVDTAYAVAFDPTGAVRWYRGFPAQPDEYALECEQQLDGNFTLFVGASTGWQPLAGRYYEFTPAGDSMATYAAGGGYYTDPHEVVVRGVGAADTSVYILGYDLRSLDLTRIGGGPSQIVAAHTILRQSPDGTVLFHWSAWDHFTLDDWVVRPVPPDLGQSTDLDLDHANSIDLDPAGDLVVSFADVTQVLKIDHGTGAVRWRFGGRLNQFTFVGDPLIGFGVQHDIRLLPNGDILLFDNGTSHPTPESRAVEYHLDTLAMTATLVWQYRRASPVFAPFAGSVQRFRNGHTLIGYGATGLMTEVSAEGVLLWEAQLDLGGSTNVFFYRVRELPSLYVHQDP